MSGYARGMVEPKSTSPDDTPDCIRVLIADQAMERLDKLQVDIEALGHEVVSSSTDIAKVAELAAETNPDIAIVTLGPSSEHALDLISEIVREASSPVIALLATDDPAYVSEAARRGVFASIVDASREELRAAIEVALHRFKEHESLQGAFNRRAVLEQAKGILMGRDGISADAAFEVLRSHSQRTGRKIYAVATSLIESNTLLSK